MESVDPNPVEPAAPTVRCPCGCYQDDGLMIMCDVCSFWGHGNCYQLLEESQVPDSVVCYYCGLSGDSQLPPTDPTINQLPLHSVRQLCLLRRFLGKAASLSVSSLNRPTLSRHLGIEGDTAVVNALFTRLLDEGYLRDGKSKRAGKIIDVDVIEHKGMIEYFYKDVDKENLYSGCDQVEEGLVDAASSIRINDDVIGREAVAKTTGRSMRGGGDSRSVAKGRSGKLTSDVVKEADGKTVGKNKVGRRLMFADKPVEETNNLTRCAKRFRASTISPAQCAFIR